jgi:hypothetical protein
MDLQMIVGGEGRSDRGPYTLIVESAPVTVSTTATPAATPAETAQATATPLPSATATPLPLRPTATSSPTPSPVAIPTCRVLVQTLRLRSGPGTVFEPPLAGLPAGTELEVLGRSADADWLNVRVQGSALTGWVNAGTQFVQCNVPIGGLLVVNAPPTPLPAPTSPPTSTPLPTSTPTNTPLPTPTLPAFVLVPGTGSSGAVTGNLRTGPGVGFVADGNMVFTNALWFFADAQPPAGRTITRVTFLLTALDDESTEVHQQNETSPAWCLFGGGDPACNVLRLNQNARWPNNNIPIYNQFYRVTTSFYLDGDVEGSPSAEWFATIEIDSPNLSQPVATLPVEPPLVPQETPTATPTPEYAQPPTPTATPTDAFAPEPQEIQVELREVGPGSTALEVNGQIVFQVAAWDPTVGTNNGDGIDAINLTVVDGTGIVYAREERMAAYCAFAGGEPDCNIYDYATAGYVWQSGAPVVSGAHALFADVIASDGRRVTWRWDIEVK